MTNFKPKVEDFLKASPSGSPDVEKIPSIRGIFEYFTRYTCPYGNEDFVYGKDLKHLGFVQDEFGNHLQKIGDSRTIFAAHIDTADRGKFPKLITKKYFSKKGDEFVGTDGTTILGADDRAGLSMLLWMMFHKVPGLYYLFNGEEQGRIGSEYAAQYFDFENKYDRIICFDRREYFSVITHQMGGRCASDGFADELIYQLNIPSLTKDKNGSYTDSESFADIIPECTNISIGYHNEHTKRENQNLTFLDEMAEAVLEVDWESLPTLRDPKESRYSGGKGQRYLWGEDDWDAYIEQRYNMKQTSNDTVEIVPIVKDNYEEDFTWGEDIKAQVIEGYVVDFLMKCEDKKKSIDTLRCDLRLDRFEQLVNDMENELYELQTNLEMVVEDRWE